MKNLLLFSTLLLTSVGALAQLTVKPNGTKDSYVYVNNQIVFVTDYVKLDKNKPGDTEASIYLRNDGQLIQGGTASTNGGNGYLSVQQNTKPTNAYAYYYWCSPVGNPVAVGDIGGTALAAGNTNFGLSSIYEDRNTITGVGTKARISVSIPEREGFSAPLTISRRWMYILTKPSTEKEDGYTRINASNGAPAGFGFTMKGVNLGEIGAPDPTEPDYGHDQTYEFRGRPNNGDFKIPVNGPNSKPKLPNKDAKMTLSGNPYPSALDLNKFFYDPANLALSAIYYYDEDRTKMTHLYSQKPFGYGVWVPGGKDNDYTTLNDHPGNYVAAPFFYYRAGGGTTGAAGTGIDKEGKRYAPIGQGFMLVGKIEAPDQFVYIKNEHRVFVPEGATSIFQRPENDANLLAYHSKGSSNSDSVWVTAGTPETEDYRMPQLRFRVVFDEALTREMLLVFSDQATDSYDRGMDGRSPLGLKSDAYFPVLTNSDTDFQPYVINTVKYDLLKRVPLSFVLNKQTRININSVDEVKKPYDNAYVFDSEENTYKEISNSGPLGHKGAQYNLPAGDYNNRFYIVFRAPKHHHNFDAPKDEDETSPRDTVLANVSFFQNNPQQQLEVQNPEGYTIKSAAMYDMSGKMVISKVNLGDSKNLSFYTGNLSEGVYLVKLITSEDLTIDYKAIVHN